MGCDLSRSQREEILRVIDRAFRVRDNSLSPENFETLGHPYVSGYLQETLSSIRDIVL